MNPDQIPGKIWTLIRSQVEKAFIADNADVQIVIRNGRLVELKVTESVSHETIKQLCAEGG